MKFCKAQHPVSLRYERDVKDIIFVLRRQGSLDLLAAGQCSYYLGPPPPPHHWKGWSVSSGENILLQPVNVFFARFLPGGSLNDTALIALS